MATNILTVGYVYFDGLKYSLQPIQTTLTGPASGDLSGNYPAPTVVKLQTHPISATPPTTGQVLSWNGSEWAGSTPTFFTAGGDLSGTPTSQTVVGLQGVPISAEGPSLTNNILQFNGSAWQVAPSPLFSAGGDLEGSNTDQVVAKIYGVPLGGYGYGIAPDNYVITAGFGNTCGWALLGDASIASNADITGTKINPNFGSQDIIGTSLDVVSYVAINDISITTGSGIPSVPPIDERNGSIYLRTDGDTSGAESIYSYEDGVWVAVGGGFSAGGDLSGSLTHQTVIALQGNAVLAQSLTSVDDGYVLTWHNATSQWEALPGPSGSFAAGGDLTGSSTHQTVIALQGNAVLSQSLTSVDDGYVLTWHNSSSQWKAEPLPVAAITLVGDVHGTLSSGTIITTVMALQDNPVEAQSLSSADDGYVLTWYNAGPYWKAEPPTGGGGGSGITELTGDVVAGPGSGSQTTTVESIQGVVISGTPSGGQALIATSGAAASWQAITTTPLSTVFIDSSSSFPYQMIEPSGTLYLIDTFAAGVVLLLTPINPIDGQFFTVKDVYGSWSISSPLFILENSNNNIINQDPWSNNQMENPYQLSVTGVSAPFTVSYNGPGTTVPVYNVGAYNTVTIASGSNNVILPQSTIYVNSTTNFPSFGYIFIWEANGAGPSSSQVEIIQYAGKTGGGTPSFTGCTSGYINNSSGTLTTGDIVSPATTLITQGNSVTFQFSTISNTWSIIEQLLSE